MNEKDDGPEQDLWRPVWKVTGDAPGDSYETESYHSMRKTIRHGKCISQNSLSYALYSSDSMTVSLCATVSR